MKPIEVLGLACVVLVSASPAHAYIGPGAGLGAIGATIALVIAVILLIAGFVWYPVKRLLKGRKSRSDSEIEKAPDGPESDKPR
jgi:hypothetical protein